MFPEWKQVAFLSEEQEKLQCRKSIEPHYCKVIKLCFAAQEFKKSSLDGAERELSTLNAYLKVRDVKVKSSPHPQEILQQAMCSGAQLVITRSSWRQYPPKHFALHDGQSDTSVFFLGKPKTA